MPTRECAPLGAPTWIDLSSSDVERAQEFYAAVFGWTFESAGPDYGGYLNASKDGRLVAGLMGKDPHRNVPDAWTTYFHTNDIGATAAAVRDAGGSNCVGPMEVKDKGWMAMAADPSGASFALWQPIGHRGFELVGEAGAPVWHQLTTRDYAGALQFYRQVLGWRLQTEADTEEFRYTTAIFGDGLGALPREQELPPSAGEQELPPSAGEQELPPPAGDSLLGVMDAGTCLPDEVPSHWVVFLGAENVDKTLQLITDNGGSVLRPAEDTPYGRLAAAADPAGAVFNLSSLR